MRALVMGPDADVEAALRDALTALGHEVLPPIPAARAGITASLRDRFVTATDRLLEADLLVADVSRPDHDVAWCVAWFLAKGRLVVLTVRANAQAGLDAMLAGNPSPWQRIVPYENAEKIPAALHDVLGMTNG